MTAPLEDRLWRQLEAAAARETRRGALRRRLAPAHRRRWAGTAATAVALAALAALVALLAGSPRPQPPANAARVLSIGGQPTDAVAAGGAVWIADGARGRLVALDPAAARPLHTVPLRSDASLFSVAATGRSVWVLPTPWRSHQAPARIGAPVALERVDAVSGRVLARIPLRLGRAPLVPFGVVAAGDDVWAWGRGGAVRIDPVTNRVARSIALPANVIVFGFAATARTAWLATDTGRVLGYDARSGRPVGAFPVLPVSRQTPLVPIGDVLVLGGGRASLTAFDAATGRQLWRAQLPARAGAVRAAGRRLWVAVASATGSQDELLLLDAATGRTLARRALPAGDIRALVPVGPALWAVSGDGTVTVLP